MKKRLLFIVLFMCGFAVYAQTAKKMGYLPHQENESVLSEPSSELIDRLAVLCKVWGFVKYHHPEVAKGSYNMDEELFSLIPLIENAESQEQINQILSEWIDKFGKITDFMSEGSYPSASDVKLLPDYSWINPTILGDVLVQQLEDMKRAVRSDSHHYIKFARYINNPVFQNEGIYESISFPDKNVQLLSLFRYWNMMQYYNPNRHLLDENWNNVLMEFIPRFLRINSEYDYVLALFSLIAKVSDTHANVWGGRNVDIINKINGGALYAPLIVKFVENKLVVTGLRTLRSGGKSVFQIGDIIETLNGISVDEIIKQRLPITPASNYPTQLRNIAKNIVRSEKEQMQINYIQDGESMHTTVKCLKPINYLVLPEPDSFQTIGSNITYIYLGSLLESDLKRYMPESLHSKGIIIDLRCYPNTFIVDKLGKYFMPHPTSFVKFSDTSIRYPGLFRFREGDKVGEDNPDYYRGKIVIIINEETQSQAEFTTMAFRVAPNVTVVGSTTAGADGDVSTIIFPGNYMSYISGIGVYYPDGTETQRVGIIPDIEVKPTIEGIRKGIDEPLQKAIEIINNSSDIQQKSISSVSISPNPVTNGFCVNGVESRDVQIAVINIQGEEILKRDLSTDKYVNIQSLPKGIYIAAITVDGRTEKIKLVKK